MSSESSSTHLKPLFAGVDVGGTNIKVGIVDGNGKVVASTKFPTLADDIASESLEKAKETLGRLLESVSCSWDDIGGLGLGTPGPMDIGAGLILTPNNLPGWRNFPVRECLQKLTGKPVVYSNEQWSPICQLGPDYFGNWRGRWHHRRRPKYRRRPQSRCRNRAHYNRYFT